MSGSAKTRTISGPVPHVRWKRGTELPWPVAVYTFRHRQALYRAHGVGEGVACLLLARAFGLRGGGPTLRLGFALAQRVSQLSQFLQAARLDHNRPRSANDTTVPWPTTR